MIEFLKKNNPFSIVYIGLILLLIKIPILIWIKPSFEFQFVWLDIGKKITESKQLYTQISEPIAPISAFFYGFIGIISFHQPIGHYIFSILLILLQAFFFNKILIVFKAYNDRSYFPALLYITFMSLSVDFITLSPVLLAITPLLLFFRNFLVHTKQSINETFFKTGVYLGIATLLYLPSVSFVLLAFMGLFFFKSVAIRQLFLILYGSIFVLVIPFTYYLLIDQSTVFCQQYLLSFSVLEKHYYHPLGKLVLLLIIPVLFLFFSVLKIWLKGIFTSYQITFQKIMFTWMTAGIFCILFDPFIGSYQLVIFVPALSFFCTHLFLLIRKKWVLNITYFVLLFSILLMKYDSFFQWSPLSKSVLHFF